MSKIELMRKRNETARYFSLASRRHRNCIRINTHNSFIHELVKFVICWNLANKGKEFLTEAISEDRKQIADIVVLDDKEIIEVLYSETEERFNKKKFPKDFFITQVHSVSLFTKEYFKEVVNELEEMLK